MMTLSEVWACFPMAENREWDNGAWIEYFVSV